LNSVAAELRVIGYVQGVGFRYFCYRKAVGLGILGWVRNEPDGSVALFAEGDRDAVEAFIAELKSGSSTSAISEVSVTWTKPTGQFHDFNISMSRYKDRDYD